ncbi:hypothetical protein JCM8547_002889 [Rhodosporidiobolus lusitaniae]
MASGRPSTSRYSLDDWAQLAPLSPQENASVQRVSAACSHRPLPPHLANSQSTAPPLPPPRSSAALSSSVPPSLWSTPKPPFTGPPANGGEQDGDASEEADPLSLALLQPIATTQQFHDWHSLVESSLEKAQESHYHLHLSTLSSHISTCSSLLSSLDAARALVSELAANEAYVSENSSALQSACEGMLEEQKHLLEVAEALTARLEYFRELERAVRLLNEPGEEVVLRPEFLEGLDRVGVCLEYLRANRDFHDSPLYLIRFQQCLARSMALIKMWFCSTVKRTGEDVRGKMGGKDLSEPALHALLYSKFETLAPSLRLLLRELEARSSPPPPAFPPPSSQSSSRPASRHQHHHQLQHQLSQSTTEEEDSFTPLLHDCLSTYTSVRLSLLSPLLSSEVRLMDPGRAELVGLAKTGCGYLRGVCMEEWELAGGFFGAGGAVEVAGGEVYRFLSHLCDTLYDSLRPRILHEPSLSVLCDLCGVLGAMMALDTDPGIEAAESTGEEDEDLDLLPPLPSDPAGSPGEGTRTTRVGGGGGGPSTGLGRLRFAALVAPILQDAQTRLVFRAQAVMQGEVGGYVPKEGEVGRWIEMGEGGEKGEKEGEGLEWPTVRTTRDVLERLERCVNNAIFLDFAAEAVSLCRTSLVSASHLLSSYASTSTATEEDKKADAQLFLIRHFLGLKEMVGGVELVRRERGVELGEALASLLRNPTSAITGALGSVLNPRALLSGLPSLGAEVMVDAKVDLDAALKLACESLISLHSSSLTAPLQTFLDQCTSFLASPSSASLSEQTWATPSSVLSLHAQFQESIEEGVKEKCRRMRRYLREEKTVKVLVPPLLEEVGEVYATFYNLIRSEYGFATSSSLVAPGELGEKLKAAAAGAVEA